MAPKKNPLNLNPLQLKTLTLFQALSQMEGVAAPHDDPGGEPGHIMISHMPRPHGDHFHLGPWVCAHRMPPVFPTKASGPRSSARS